MDLAEFLRLFPMRTPNIMWLIGAGASASAGVPTAGDMVWDFKRRVFCAETRKPIALCPPLGDESFRQRLDSYFQSKGTFPAPGSEDEYSHYFEYTYPDERERRKYIDDQVSRARLSQGYVALAALVKLGRIKTLWSTNFDRLVEDGLAHLFGGTSYFYVATPESSSNAAFALNEGDRPLLVKLHGDFHSQRLKNTRDELRDQDRELRRCLTQECGRRGLAIVGYSGRDNSIMLALEEALSLHGDKGFPAGLYWFHRVGSQPFARVVQLLQQARSLGISAGMVEVATFDELMHDLFTLIEDVSDEIKEMLRQDRRRLVATEVPAPGTNWPVIRMNAIPVVESPSVCRRVVCTIGGTGEVKNAIRTASAQVIAVRREVGVICFGSDAEVHKAFDPHSITEFDLFPIDAGRMTFDTAELGLLNEAIVQAITRERPVAARSTRQGWKLFPDPQRILDPRLNALAAIEGGFTGIVSNTDTAWFDAALVKLTRKLDRLWLLFEPSVWIDWPAATAPESEQHNFGTEVLLDSDDALTDIRRKAIQEFTRERSARRYNRQLLAWMDAWVSLLVGPGNVADGDTSVRCFGVGDGIDAVFKLARTTAFSLRM